MIQAALTGSIGMGKSTVAAMFADLGAATWNADDAVHRLYGKGGAAVAPVAAAFQASLVDGAIDRNILADIVLDDDAALRDLEAIVHPLVLKDRSDFLERAEAAGAKVAVLDIPLLFETGAADAFDYVIVVSASPAIQRARVLSRPGMSREKFAAILRKQTPDTDKRARADFIINTGVSITETREQVEAVFKKISERLS